MFTRGENERKLFAGFKTHDGRFPRSNTLASCDLDLDVSSVSLHVKAVDDRIIVSYHKEKETDYKKCAEVKFPKLNFKSFFVSLLARSAADSFIRYDVSTMTLSTNAENPIVSEFEAKYDQNMPKLFKEISFYKSNAEAIKAMHKVDPSALDIPKIHSNQLFVYDTLDYSNTQLSRSIEETSSILSFVESQNASTAEMGHQLIFALNKWLEESQKEYEMMDKDVGRLVAEMEAMNFDNLFETTDKLLTDITVKFEQTSTDFKELRRFSKVIKRNLDTLHDKSNQVHGFARSVKNMGKHVSGRKTRRANSKLATMLVVLGVVTIFALLSILYKLSAGSKADILG